MSSLSSETKAILVVVAIGLIVHLVITNKETKKPTTIISDEPRIIKSTGEEDDEEEPKGFVPIDETGGKFSSFKSGTKNKKLKTEEMFNVDNLLPKEKNPDWFDSVPDPINVKDKRLININRTIGVNTIGTSRKNASTDMRGSIPAPKFTPPWGMSSIEPDPYRKPNLF